MNKATILMCGIIVPSTIKVEVVLENLRYYKEVTVAESNECKENSGRGRRGDTKEPDHLTSVDNGKDFS